MGNYPENTLARVSLIMSPETLLFLSQAVSVVECRKLSFWKLNQCDRLMRDRWTCRNSVAVSGQFVRDKHSTKRRCVISHFSCLPFAGICREITITSLIVRTQQFQSNQRWRGLCGAPHPSALMFVVGQVFGVLFNSRRPQFNCAE